MRNVVVAVAASLAASSAAVADVDINDATDTINFTGGAGTITNVSSITGLQNLTIAGELTANKITVTTGGNIASGSNEVVTGGQLFDVKGELDADITANAANIASNKTAIEDNAEDRKSTRLNSSHVARSYAVFCLKKKIHYET